ncbi:hypothetical protein [Streptomyces sp. NPDC048527]
MFIDIDPSDLPSGEELLTEDAATAPLAQVTQEVLQSVSYRTHEE